MAIYSVQAPDGNIYDINGPDGASEADLFAATRQLMGQARATSLQQQIEELRTRKARPEEVSGFGAARAAGWQNLQADLAAVAGKTGIMSEDAAEKTIAEKKKEAARVFTPTENWSDAPWTKFKELVGGSLPYMAAPVAAGAAAAALPLTGVAGATAGLIGTGLAGLASATQFTGSNLSRQLEEQEGDKKSLAKTELAPAIAGAIPQAALDIVSFRMMPIIGRAFKSVGKELTEEQLKQVAQRGLLNNMGRSGLKTGSVESLTETGQQFIERLQAGLNITDEKARAEYLESAIGGGVLGFPLGALGGIGARGRARNKLAEIEAGRTPPEQEQQTGTALALMGERGVTAPPTEQTPVEFMGRENVPAAQQEQIRQLENRSRVPTTAEAVRVNPDGTTGRVVANVPGAASGQQGVLNIFGDEDVTARELGQRMGAIQQAPAVYPKTNAPRLDAPATTDSRQGALQFAPAAPETPEGKLQAQLTAVQKQRAFEAAEQQREEQKQAELDKIVKQAAAQEDKTQPTFPTAKAGQPTQQQQLDLFTRKQAPTPSRAEGLRRGVGEQIEPLAPEQIDNRQAPRQGELRFDLTPQEQAYEAAERQRAEQEQAERDRTTTGRATQQEQLSLFSRKQAPTPSRAEGLRRGVGEQREEQAPPQPQAIVTAQALDVLGIPKSAPAYKLSLGKDLADPEQRLYVSDALRRLAANPNTKPDVRTNIKNVLQMSPFVQVQGELFGEGGGKTRQPTLKTLEARNANAPKSTGTTAESTAESGASEPPVDVGGASVEPTSTSAESTTGVSESKERGLADTDGGAKPDNDGKGEAQPSVTEEEAALNVKVREWDRANRTHRSEAWTDGELEATPAFDAVKAQGASVPAHGISKVGTLSQGVKDLIAMVNGGIRPGLFFAALTRPDSAAGVGVATGTAGGVAYRDGPFIITFREGITSPTSADITGVLVNPSHAEIIPALRAVLPNVRIESYQDVQTLLGEPKTKAAPKAKKETKKETKAEPKAEEELSQEEQDALQAELDAELTGAPVEAKPKAKTEPKTKAASKAKATPEAEPEVEVEAQTEAEVNPEWETLAAKETNEYQRWFAANIQKYKIDKDDIGKSRDPDRRKVGSLLRGPAKAKKTTTSDLLARNSAHVYFSKMPRIVDNLRNMAFDIATNTPRFKEGLQNVPAPEAKFFKGMSKTAAEHAQRWVQANLSPEANTKLDQMITEYAEAEAKFNDKNFLDDILNQGKTVEGYKEAHENDLVAVSKAMLDKKPKGRKKALHKTEAEVENLDTTETGPLEWNEVSLDALADRFRELPQSAVSRLGVPLHPAVRAMLEAGNLQGALDALAGQSTGIVGRIVRLLAGVVGGTRVEVVNNLVGEDGRPAAGLFDPATNTIRLDSKTGLNNHTLIHEMTHGALSHILDNANHPVTRQLTKIFDSVKPMLDTAYGAQSLQEFVAEAWGNVEFREKLSALHPDGTPISAWQRFSNTVKNFMRSMIGMQHKGIESAYDQTDRLMESIISPAPGMRTAGSLYLAASNPSMASAFFNSMGQAYNKIPYFNTDTKDAFRNVFTARIPDAIRRFLLSALPANALSDVAESIIPMAKQFDKLVHLKSGREGRLYSEVEPTINRVRDWAKKQSADTMRNFNEVVYESTVNRVDPSKLRSAYVDKYGNSLTDTSGNKLADAWDALEPKWKELQRNGGAQVYGEMRDTYKKLYDKIGDILKTRLDDEFGKSKEADKAYGMLKKLFDERGIIEPYFPLTRRGDYWLSYNMAINNPDGTPKSNEQYIEAFETKIARDRAVADLQAMADADKNLKFSDVNEFRKGEKINYSNAPSSSFMGRVLDVLDANNVGAESREAIMELYLNALPENSFAQSFRNRKDTLGFDKDAVRAFSNKTYGITRQLANVEYGAKFQQLGSDISKYVRKLTGDKEQAQMYEREFAKRIKFVLHPEIAEWSKLSTSIGFNALLGFNLSSAIVNITQLPLVTLPYLGGKYGYSETMKAIGEATRLFTASGFKDKARVDILGVKSDVSAGPSMANYDWSDPSKLPPEIRKYATLVEKALDYGQLNRSQIFDILAVDKTDSVGNKVNAMSGFMFHHGERMNREITLATAYDLELQRMKSNPTKEEAVMTTAQKQERAAENAINITELTNGSASASAAPSLAQGNIGRILFMFKRYGVSMYYMLFKTAMETVKGQDSKTRAAALRQVAGIYGSSALLAGLKGVPMFGIAAMIYNMFKDDDDDDFETQVRKWSGETAYSGALNGLTNLEFASRIGLSDLIFRDQKPPESQTVLLTALETLGGPVYGVGKKFERGITLIGEGHIERGVEQMLPSAIGNMLKGVRFGTEGATTLRGDPIVGDINMWNAGAQMLGFAPANYIAQQEINANLKGFERTVIKQQKSLLLNYYMAARQGDTEAVQDITQKMGEFNKKHPTIAISGDTLRRSMEGHAKASAQKYHGLTFNKKLLPEIMASEREYHGE